jgi:hypothetical protein
MVDLLLEKAQFGVLELVDDVDIPGAQGAIAASIPSIAPLT